MNKTGNNVHNILIMGYDGDDFVLRDFHREMQRSATDYGLSCDRLGRNPAAADRTYNTTESRRVKYPLILSWSKDGAGVVRQAHHERILLLV